MIVEADQCQLAGAGRPDDICCPQVCCEFRDGSIGITHADECLLAGVVLPLDQCGGEPQPDVCCQQPDGTVVTVPQDACIGAGGQAVDVDVCENVCCHSEAAGTFQVTPIGACDGNAVAPDMCEEVCCVDEMGANLLPAGACSTDVVPVDQCEDVCCLREGEVPAQVPAVMCVEPAVMVQPERCIEMVCCVLPDGSTLETDPITCQERGGQANELAACDEPLCCRVPDGTFQDLSAERCEAAGGFPAAGDMCDDVCCIDEENQTLTISRGQCEDGGGAVAPQEACEEAVHRIMDRMPTTDLQVGYLALSRSGETGAHAIHGGFNYAHTTEAAGRMIDASHG